MDLRHASFGFSASNEVMYIEISGEFAFLSVGR